MEDNAAQADGAEQSQDASTDATRIAEAVAAARALADRLSSAPNRFGDGRYAPRTREYLSRLDMMHVEEICAESAVIATTSPREYAELYGDLIGSVEGLTRSVATASDRLDQEELSFQLANVADDVVAGRAEALGRSLTRLEQRSGAIAAQKKIRERAESFDSQLSDLQIQVTRAASQLGLDIKKLDWGVYAEEEASAAGNWRAGAISTGIAAAIVSLAALLHLIGNSESVSGVVLKLGAGVSLLTLAGYMASQASDHRAESKLARRKALDYATLNLFTADLDQSVRDEVLRRFGLTQFSSTAVNVADAERGDGSPVVDQIVGRVINILRPPTAG